MVGYTDGKWKLVRSREPGIHPASLYDLAVDPEEMTDVAAAHPKIAARLEAALSKMLEEIPAASAVEEHQSDDPELIKELEALGYIGD